MTAHFPLANSMAAATFCASSECSDSPCALESLSAACSDTTAAATVVVRGEFGS